jgi:toxin ParE1/3/4
MLIVLSDKAIEDLVEAESYYELQKQGLGYQFVMEVESALNALSMFYEFPIRYDQVRIKQVKIFPFLIHYVVETEAQIITVDTIVHARRDSPLSR